MNLRTDALAAPQQLCVVIERQIRIEAVDDVELGEGLVGTLPKLVPGLLEGHRVRLGHAGFETRKRAEQAARLADIRRLSERWLDGFDFQAFEDRINSLPQFTRDIAIEGHDTLNIHYVHQESKVKGAIPLLFVHGCASSFSTSSSLCS